MLDSLVELLDEHIDVIPTNVSDGLPPKRLIEHRIEFVPWAKIPAKIPCRM